MDSSTDTGQMESWSVDEVYDFIKKHFTEEIARKFKDQNMKGSLLRFFAMNASIEQFIACGLEDIGSQMEFQRLVKEQCCDVHGSTVILTSSSSQSSDGSYSSRCCDSNVKPSRKALKHMPSLDAKIYRAKRRTVQEKAVKRWPGNNIPVFRKNVKALEELNELVEELAATCTYEPCGFTKEGIRKHILDTLNERRRRIKKGHDYTKGDARQKKHNPNADCNEKGQELTWLTTEMDDDCEDDHVSIQQVPPPNSKSKEKPKSTYASTTEMEIKVNVPKCKVGPSNTDDFMALNRKTAEVIICVAFNAINIKEISRSQLAAATKPLKLKLKASLSKEEYLEPVADGLIKAGYVRLTKELSRDLVIVRDDIIVLKPF